jgi:hypothetical protein
VKKVVRQINHQETPFLDCPSVPRDKTKTAACSAWENSHQAYTLHAELCIFLAKGFVGEMVCKNKNFITMERWLAGSGNVFILSSELVLLIGIADKLSSVPSESLRLPAATGHPAAPRNPPEPIPAGANLCEPAF